MEHKFYDTQTNTWITVTREKWSWQAHYDNGTSLDQFDKHGRFHRFAEIDQSRLKYFRMVSDQTDGVFTIKFEPKSMKLIHFYKNVGLQTPGNGEFLRGKTGRFRLYVFGFERKINTGLLASPITVKLFNVIMPNNELIVLDDINKLSI